MKNIDSKAKNKRITWVDYFKCFGILLMILGHISFGNKFDIFIHAFNMPMFFFISGILFKPLLDKKEYSKTIKKKAKTLLLPYLCISIIHYCIWLITNYTYKNRLLPLTSLLWINNNSLPNTFGALWFLTAFFFTQFIYYTIDTFIKNKPLKSVMFFCIAIFGCLAKNTFMIVLPWSLDAAFVGVGLLHIGRLLYEFDNKKIKFLLNEKITFKKIAFIILTGCLITVSIFINGLVNMRTGNYSCILLFFVNAVTASIVGIGLAQALASITKKLKLKIVDSYVTSISIGAIVYVCFNQIVIYYITNLIPSSHLVLVQLLNKAIIFLITLLILEVLNIIINKLKLIRILFGLEYKPKLSLICYLFLVIILGSSIYLGKYRYKNYRSEIKNIVKQVEKPKIDKIKESKFKDSEIINAIANENINYLLDNHLNEVIKYSFLSSSNMKNFKGNNNYEEKILNETEGFIQLWKHYGQISLPNISGENTNENAVRPWAHTSYILAIYLNFDIIDFEKTNYTYDQLKTMTLNLITELASKHCSNYYSGWGNSWQSAEWAENIGFAAWLLWDDLSNEAKEDITNMIVYEANRFIEYEIPYYKDENGKIIYKGDTKGEENAWNSRILALATCMYPENKNSKKWEEELIKLLLSSTAKPDDINSDNIIDEYKLKEVLKGSNINEDGTVINHNKYHLDYSACIAEGMSDTIIIYALADRPLLESSIFNIDEIYQALVETNLGKYDKTKKGHYFYERTDKNLASFDVNMPGENDWGGKWYASYYLLDTIVETFKLDQNVEIKASDWSNKHLEYIDKQINKETSEKIKGQYFFKNENNFVSGETYMAHNMCKAYLIKLFFANDML